MRAVNDGSLSARKLPHWTGRPESRSEEQEKVATVPMMKVTDRLSLSAGSSIGQDKRQFVFFGGGGGGGV